MTFREWDDLLRWSVFMGPVRELYLHREGGRPVVWTRRGSSDGCLVPCEIIATAVFP